MLFKNVILILFALLTRLYCVNCCLKDCEICGKNSEKCIFNVINCTIKCKCLDGYFGSKCQQNSFESINNNQILKKKVWENIFQNLADSESNSDWNRMKTSIRILEQLYIDFKSDNSMDLVDVNKTSLIFKRLKDHRFLIDKSSHINLTKIIDILISIFLSKAHDENQNYRLYKKSCLKLIRSFDILSGSLSFKEEMVILTFLKQSC